jgi:hypothetical protein
VVPPTPKTKQAKKKPGTEKHHAPKLVHTLTSDYTILVY